LPSPSPTPSPSRVSRLPGRYKWTWFGNETLTFLPDGKAKWKDGEDLWPWKVTSASRRVIASEHGLKGRKFTITFDREMKTGIIEGDMATRKTEILTAE
jgi:hypothetical protein